MRRNAALFTEVPAMYVLRLAVATLIMSGLCFSLAKEIGAGLRTGKIRYGRGPGEHFAHRKQQPLMFWLLLALFALFGAASVGVIAWVALVPISA